MIFLSPVSPLRALGPIQGSYAAHPGQWWQMNTTRVLAGRYRTQMYREKTAGRCICAPILVRGNLPRLMFLSRFSPLRLLGRTQQRATHGQEAGVPTSTGLRAEAEGEDAATVVPSLCVVGDACVFVQIV